MRTYLSACAALAATALALSGCFYAPRHDGYARAPAPVVYVHPRPDYAPPPPEYRPPPPGLGANISIHG